MDISQTMIGHHLQHPLGPGAMLYPGKGSAWQPVVTSLPSLVDIPKESIIANTDFTTTSVIAKRRLSSKKRKKVASQQQQQTGEGGSSGSSDQRTSCSPLGSANGSPAVTSTTYTPPAFEKSQSQDDSLARSTTGASVSGQNVTTSSTTHAPHLIGHHPSVSVSGGVQFHHPNVAGSSQFISVAPSVSGAYHHPTMATAQTQFANPMLSQLQQELNYRFLQDRSSGVFIAHPNQVDQAHQSQQQQQVHGFKLHRSSARGGDGSQPMETNTSLSLPSSSNGAAVAATSGGGSRGLSEQPGFKWCYAHVAIAKQIQKQQHQELRANEIGGSTSTTASSVITLNHSRADSVQNVTTALPSVSVSVAAAAAAHHQQQQAQQQQQQQLALLQMYGLPAASAVPAAAMPGSYMAVPYSSVQEVQLRMQQMAAAANVTGATSLHPGVSLVKPVGMDAIACGTTAEPLLSLNPAVAAAAANGATTIQMVNGLHLQAGPFAGHTVPLAAVAAAPSDLNNAVFHSAASGQWMAPVPVVGSCIVNPLQPGIMATPWVK